MDNIRMTAAVPVISMSLPADQFAHDFGASFERFGFAMITDHGIDPALIDDAWAKAKAFFALPEATKRAYHITGGGARAAIPPSGPRLRRAPRKSTSRNSGVGRDLPAGHHLAAQQPNNVWPAEVAGFRAVYDRLFAEFDRVGGRLLSGIAATSALRPISSTTPSRTATA
jgi:isopenicillin N synthase-like dioxygenase